MDPTSAIRKPQFLQPLFAWGGHLVYNVFLPTLGGILISEISHLKILGSDFVSIFSSSLGIKVMYIMPFLNSFIALYL